MSAVNKNPLFKKIARRNNKYRRKSYDLAYNAQENISMCEDDGLVHITPIVALFNMNTKELKSFLGKSKWKSIANGSFERNQEIMFIVLELDDFPSNKKKAEIISFIYKFSDISLTLICNIGIKHLGMMFAHRINEWSEDCSFLELEKRQKMYSDTKRMARRLNYPFDPSAKWRDIEIAHTTLTALYEGARLKVPADKDFNLPVLCQKIIEDNLKFEDFKVKALKCLSDFSKEKALMKHCILSYCERSYKGSYVAFHIEKNGIHTTLGVNFNKYKFSFTRDQHYGKRNEIIKDHYFHDVAKAIIQTLNKKIPKNEHKRSI